jgi:hypothetical protein
VLSPKKKPDLQKVGWKGITCDAFGVVKSMKVEPISERGKLTLSLSGVKVDLLIAPFVLCRVE